MDNRTFGYARVSTREQNEDRQIEALTAFGVSKDNIIVDKCSGKDTEREGYQYLKKQILRSGDTLVIKELDRLSRNKADVKRELEFFKKKGVHIRMQVILNELLQWKNVQLADSRTAGALYTDSGFIVTNQTGGYIEPRTFKDYYDEMLQAAGLGHYTFHALRHTFATRALEQGMNAKTLSTLLGHYSVSFTLDTYTHVLDSQKHEEMQLMEELFTIPDSPQQHSYPVIVTPCPNGFIFNPVDFEALSIEADNIQYGISCIQSAICQRLAESYPPTPTPVDELVVNFGEFVVVVNI